MTDDSTIKATVQITYDSRTTQWGAFLQHGAWATVRYFASYPAAVEYTKAKLDEWATTSLLDTAEREAAPQQLPLPLED
jgi:hypothetical protein